ncbi:heavy metal translocating P-type ATPase [Kordiimonas aquimaris]|uniref:heavy metal translocating P-type ATPase n=1 Tax=Kordiimonas aquimaris TaxID=707591 RepID=UPI0021D0E4A4|nr:heavy metal translocating P-type ATPase [Kordiimonas aquimaris]
MSMTTSFSSLAQHLENGEFQLELAVEGIHCAACIRLIENALSANDEVTYVRVNMTTERLSFQWRGDAIQGDVLAAQVTKLGYKLHAPNDGRADERVENHEKLLLKAIAVSGFAAGNLMLLSIGLWSTSSETMGFATRELLHWVSALIALPTIVYAGRPFFQSAIAVLKQGKTNMDVPISIAVILASLMSISEAMRQGEHVYFDSAVMLLFFLLIGRYLDARAKGKARDSASRLLSKLAGTAAVYIDGVLKRIPIKELTGGMTVLVAAGESIPADGHITKGETDIDLSLISGETLPQHAAIGTQTLAGTLNITAPIEVHVEKASNESLLSKIVRMMEVAEQGAARYVRLADKAASLYTPVVHLFGALTFIGWLALGVEWQVALLNAVTVLIITCPCALGLAVPVVQVLASGELLKNGILLRSGDALERLACVDTIVFDKTGTLTVGKPLLVSGEYTSEHKQLAASLASNSQHPLSKAIYASWEGTVEKLDVQELPGKGLQANVDGKLVRLGSKAWCGDKEHESTSDNILELWLSIDDKPQACFEFSDAIRSDAKKVLASLHQLGIETHLLSGDRTEIANQVALTLNIQHVSAETSPIDKCAYIEKLKEHGHNVLMVGDGLNDAPALAAAHVSMSPSSALDITQNTADIVFQGEQLEPVFGTLLTARQSNKLVKQNFGLAVVYNIFAIPLAVMGFVTPMIAAVAMSGSSLVVIANAFRLRLQKARP